MNLPTLIDQHLPRLHGNRQGLSYGQLSVLLLAYIVSQADHRLCAVEPYRDGTFDITPLNDLHKQILSLMAVPESVYDLTKISTRLTN